MTTHQWRTVAEYFELVECFTECFQRLLSQLDAMERNIAVVAALMPNLPPPPIDELRASRGNLLLCLEELKKPFVDFERIATLNLVADVTALLIRAQQWHKTVRQGEQSSLS